MEVKWETIYSTSSGYIKLERAKVPGGWFIKVYVQDGGGGFFYPDPNHEWDGNSLP